MDESHDGQSPHPIHLSPFPPHQWQWTTVTLSLFDPDPPAATAHVQSAPDCSDHTTSSSHQQHQHDNQKQPLSLPSSPLISSEPTHVDYAHLAHLPAHIVFADEGPLFNLQARFHYYNARHFHSLLSACEVLWSTRMTLCAGLCHYQPLAGYCSIRLSHPLLQFRPKQDCINTLLHEMIHAYLFLTDGNQDHDGHGPAFCQWMHKLNAAEPAVNITVFHTFNDEVNEHRKHVWQCNGPCKDLPPFFGIVRRAMNRPPQKADWWFEKHRRECGGTHEKIAGPEPKTKPSAKRRRVMVDKGLEPDATVHGKAGKKRKVLKQEERVFAGKIDGYLVKGSGAFDAPETSPVSGARPGRDIVDLTADSDDDGVVLVRTSDP